MPDQAANPRVPVLIFGSHITALGVLRFLQSRGIPCFVVDETKDIIVRSRWYRPTERTLAETEDSDELADFLRSLKVPRAVLIACSDRWAHAVAGLPAEVKDRFPASVPPLDVVLQFVDKGRFRDLVDRLGIPHPRTLEVRVPADLDQVTDADLATGFLKPTDSQQHHVLFGTKGTFVHSRDAAAHLIERATAAGITFMLQEWIPGGPETTYLIDGFVDRHGAITTMVARRRVRMDPPKIANTATDVTVPLPAVEEAVVAVRTLLSAVAYRGIFSVEFKFDERDGHLKIIELNSRPFWHIGHIAKAGADLAWMSYLDAQELPLPVTMGYQTGRYGIYEIPDVAALMRAWGSFRRPDGPVLAPWLKGDHALFWWTDPAPAMVDVWRAIHGRFTKVIARLRRAQVRSASRPT